MQTYSPKQRMLLRLWQNNELRRINLLEGAVRSGKTWVSLVLWAFWVAEMPRGKAYLMVAKTLTSLRRNVLDLLQTLVGDSNFTYSIPAKEACLFGRRIYLEGVNDARAEGKIRGMTLQGAYCDELTLFTEEFFTMLLSRLSLPGAKLFATTNPDNPRHWLMERYISRAADLDLLDLPFTMDDNPFLDPAYVRQLKREYTGVYYDRFILGLWKAAEGLIYRQFADGPGRWVKRFPSCAERDAWLSDVDFVSVGVDFGGNRSLTTFVATAVHRGYQKLTVLADHHIVGGKGEIDSGRVNREFIGFARKLCEDFPALRIRYCFADSEAQYLISGLRKAVRAAGLALQIGDSAKHGVIQRIICANTLLGQDRLLLLDGCKLVKAGLESAVWDPKHPDRDVRLDNFSTDIDILDAFEYSWERFMPKLLPNR